VTPIAVSSGTRKLDGADAAPFLPRILRRKATPPAGALDARASAAIEGRKPAVAAAPVPRVFQRAPAPKRIKASRGGWRPLLFKLLVGIGIASGAVALQDQMPQMESRGASLNATTTTGSIAPVAAQPIAPIAKLTGHVGAVSALTYANDGREIITVARDATLKVWNASSASLMRTIELDDGPASALAVSGTRALTGHANGTTVLWDIETARKIATFKRNDAEIWSLAFLGGPQRFAAASHDWKVAVWDTATTGAPSHLLDAHDNAVQAVSYGATAAGPVLATGGADKAVKLWNLETLEEIRTHRGHRDYITAVTMADGGKDVASSSLDGKIRIWSARSGRLTRALSGHQGRANALAFTASGDVLASAGEDGRVRIWDFKRRRTPKTLPSHDGSVMAVAFSPDGQHIASAGDDGVVRIWDNPLARAVTN
jgi:WD40 repeat protein